MPPKKTKKHDRPPRQRLPAGDTLASDSEKLLAGADEKPAKRVELTRAGAYSPAAFFDSDLTQLALTTANFGASEWLREQIGLTQDPDPKIKQRALTELRKYMKDVMAHQEKVTATSVRETEDDRGNRIVETLTTTRLLNTMETAYAEHTDPRRRNAEQLTRTTKPEGSVPTRTGGEDDDWANGDGSSDEPRRGEPSNEDAGPSGNAHADDPADDPAQEDATQA